MTQAGPRVLVVDDELAIRRFLKAALASHGYVVFEAACGKEAVFEVTAHRPDVVTKAPRWIPASLLAGGKRGAPLGAADAFVG